jgi:integrase
MSVKLIKGKWKLDCWPDGRYGKHIRLWLPQSITTEQEAKAFERLYLNMARRRKVDISVTDYSIRALWPRYYDHQCTNFDSEATHINIKDSGQNILRYIGDIDVTRVSNEVPEYLKTCLKKVISKKTKKHLSNATINKHLLWLSGFLRYCRDILNIPVPVIKIRLLKVNRKLPETLTPDEARRFIMACPPFYRVLYSFLYLCGLRSHEARYIKWTDIDNGFVTVTGKGSKQRSVPVPKWLLDQLHNIEHINEFIFYNPISKKPIQHLFFSTKRILKEAGIDKHITPHGLRHSFGSNSIISGVNPAVLQAFLGHSKLSTTQLYVQIASASLREASEKVMDITGLDDKRIHAITPGTDNTT